MKLRLEEVESKRICGEGFTLISSAHAMVGHSKGSITVAKVSDNSLTDVFQRNRMSIR